MLTNKYLAIPLFLAIMLTVFWLTFDVIGGRLSDLMENGIGIVTDAVAEGLDSYGINPVVKSLIIDCKVSEVGYGILEKRSYCGGEFFLIRKLQNFRRRIR